MFFTRKTTPSVHSTNSRAPCSISASKPFCVSKLIRSAIGMLSPSILSDSLSNSSRFSKSVSFSSATSPGVGSVAPGLSTRTNTDLVAGEALTAALPTRRTSSPKRLRQAFQVLWIDVDQAMPRSIDIGDQKEGNRDDQRQHESKLSRGLAVSRPVAEQHVGAQGDGRHETPRGGRNPVPERGLRVALRIDHVVHASERQRRNRRWLRGGRSADRSPEISLQLAGPRIDLRPPSIVVSDVEQDALAEVVAKKLAHICSIRRRQKVGAQDSGPDRVGLGFLEILALFVAIGGHRKPEPDDQCEQRQGGRK